MKTQKFFRYLWRIDAILIFIAAAAIVFGVGVLIFQEFQERVAARVHTEAGVPVAGDDSGHFTLGQAEIILGTPVLRFDLVLSKAGTGFSSGGYNETRNMLFVDPRQEIAHWLLPDNNDVIAERLDIKDTKNPMRQPLLATAVLIKAPVEHSESVTGKLLLFDAEGKNTVEVGNKVRNLHIATLNTDQIDVLFEREGHLVMAGFDSKSLIKRTEHAIEVPQLK